MLIFPMISMIQERIHDTGFACICPSSKKSPTSFSIQHRPNNKAKSIKTFASFGPMIIFQLSARLPVECEHAYGLLSSTWPYEGSIRLKFITIKACTCIMAMQVILDATSDTVFFLNIHHFHPRMQNAWRRIRHQLNGLITPMQSYCTYETSTIFMGFLVCEAIILWRR